MGKVIRVWILFAIATCAISVTLQAQQSSSSDKDFEKTLQRLSTQAAQSYAGPAVTGFGSNLNAGWFHRAPSARLFGFDLEFGGVAMGTLFQDENKTFSFSGIFQLDSSQAYGLTTNINDPNFNALPPQQKEQTRQSIINQIRGKDFTGRIFGPTIIGDDKDTVRLGFPGTQVTFTDPFGVKRTVTVPATNVSTPVTGLVGDKRLFGKIIVPLAAPQLTIGTILGSQFTFRYLPDINVSDEIGKVKYFGFGIQHNPGVWFGDPLPFDLSVGYFTQNFKVGEFIDASATAYGFNISKRLGWGALNLTPYAGYLKEKSNMTFTYNYTLDTPAGKIPQKINFELEGENKSKITVGLSIKILIVNVNADYNFGDFKSASAGVMIII